MIKLKDTLVEAFDLNQQQDVLIKGYGKVKRKQLFDILRQDLHRMADALPIEEMGDIDFEYLRSMIYKIDAFLNAVFELDK